MVFLWIVAHVLKMTFRRNLVLIIFRLVRRNTEIMIVTRCYMIPLSSLRLRLLPHLVGLNQGSRLQLLLSLLSQPGLLILHLLHHSSLLLLLFDPLIITPISLSLRILHLRFLFSSWFGLFLFNRFDLYNLLGLFSW